MRDRGHKAGLNRKTGTGRERGRKLIHPLRATRSSTLSQGDSWLERYYVTIPHGRRAQRAPRFSGFQRQRRPTTRGLAVLCFLWILCEKKIISARTGIYFTQNPQNPQNFPICELKERMGKWFESTEFVIDSVMTAGAVGTKETER